MNAHARWSNHHFVAPAIGVAGCGQPTDDLRDEHAILARVLVLYERAAERIERHEDVWPGVVSRLAHLVRRCIEEHHERHEEEDIFPRLLRADSELVASLVRQHAMGRRLTSTIEDLAAGKAWRDPGCRARLVKALREYARRARAHAAYEEAVVFPALRTALEPGELERRHALQMRNMSAPLGMDYHAAALRDLAVLGAAIG